LELATADMGWGTAVCSIEGVGCPADDCFCAGDQFWGYAFWDGTGWESYPVGASQSVISATGQVEGWRWGTGEEPTLIAPARAEAALAALAWLRTQQEADGGYGGMGASVEMLFALAANGEDAATWRVDDGPSLLDYAAANGASYSREGVAAAGKLALALTGVDGCWPADALTPSAYYSPTIGALAGDAGPLALGMLGALALGEPLDPNNAKLLDDLALDEGGWEWAPDWGRDTNTTSLAIQALLAAGRSASERSIHDGLVFLSEAQSDQGGVAYDTTTGVADANSTAFAIQALLAAGIDPTTWARSGDLWRYLLSLQTAEGALKWQASQAEPNALATQQAVAAFVGRSLPYRVTELPVCPATGQ
jgi:hypothetical protein